jgi:nicotinamidase-related amidase
MLKIEDCCLVIVDVQGKLAALMYNSENLFRNIQILIKSCKIMSIPILWCQQSAAGGKALGSTVLEIANLLTDNQPINKTSFSCCGCEEFNSKLQSLARRQILLCGIEAHVCIYQTAFDLIKAGREVHLITDAVSSRTAENRQLGIERMKTEGVRLSSAEMAVFELMKTADYPQFKQIAGLVK